MLKKNYRGRDEGGVEVEVETGVDAEVNTEREGRSKGSGRDGDRGTIFLVGREIIMLSEGGTL